MRWTLLVVIVLALTALWQRSAQACIWDRDTLAQEAAGAHHVIGVLAGGFARNPPLYYEMRLKRAAAEIAGAPDKLDAYDDAAVACDRLRRSDEAIEWMAKKLVALERAGDSAKTGKPSHWYRYRANLGTFHAHRWIGKGADFDHLEDLERARDLIKQAIEDNPDAHFGRERYQLRAIEWLLSRPRLAVGQDLPTFLPIGRDSLHATGANDTLAKLGLKDAVEGIAGLVALGAAWESVDVTYALVVALKADGKQALALLAMRRLAELVAAGRGSLVQGAPKGEELRELVAKHHMIENPAAVEKEFVRLRRQADTWHQRRTAYLLERLGKGEHPDTHPGFWSAFEGDPERFLPRSTDPGAPPRKANPEAVDLPGARGGRCSCAQVGSPASPRPWPWLGLGVALLLGGRQRLGLS